MKKLLVSLFAMVLIFSFAGCGDSAGDENPADENGQYSSDSSSGLDELMPSNPMSGDSESNLIDKNAAKKLALDHAGVKEDEIKDFKIELDKEDGKTYYEIDFKRDGYEYDYKINAEDGEIIKSDKKADN